MTIKRQYVCPKCLADGDTVQVSIACYPRASDGGSFCLDLLAKCTACGAKWIFNTIVVSEEAK